MITAQREQLSVDEVINDEIKNNEREADWSGEG